MIVLLNGPLGIGKSTLAEALTESIDGCVMLDGDRLIAVILGDLERQTYVLEREALTARLGTDLGEHFDVSALPADLVDAMLRRLGLR